MARHSLERYHQFDYDNVQVIAYENDYYETTVLKCFILMEMKTQWTTSKTCHVCTITSVP